MLARRPSSAPPCNIRPARPSASATPSPLFSVPKAIRPDPSWCSDSTASLQPPAGPPSATGTAGHAAYPQAAVARHRQRADAVVGQAVAAQGIVAVLRDGAAGRIEIVQAVGRADPDAA